MSTAAVSEAGPSEPFASARWGLRHFVGIVLAVTAIRLAGIWLSAVELNIDEAQYWAWSRHFAFGYFSKPPLIAWLIAATTSVCGDGEACIRAAAPLFYAGTSLAAYAIASLLYGRAAAILAGLTTLFAIAVIFSSRIMSTDVPLLFFWSLALLAYVNRRRGGGWPWLVLLAAAFGLGLLAKYAMAYFVLSVFCAGFMSADGRKSLRDGPLWLALIVGGLALLPNLAWNAGNSFATFRHLGGNVAGKGLVFSVGEGLEFFFAQFLVAGPIVFGVLLFVLIRARSVDLQDRDRLLLAFTLPALVLVSGLAFVTRAYPNWAAVSYISAMVFVPALLLRRGHARLARFGIGVGVVFQIVLLIGDPFADRIDLAAFGIGSPYAETMGMRDRADRVEAYAVKLGIDTIVPESRRDLSGLTYYLRDRNLAIRAWPATKNPPHNFYEQTWPLAAPLPGRLLTIAECEKPGRHAHLYGKAEFLEALRYRYNGQTGRHDYLFRLSEPVGPPAEPAPCYGPRP